MMINPTFDILTQEYFLRFNINRPIRNKETRAETNITKMSKTSKQGGKLQGVWNLIGNRASIMDNTSPPPTDL